MLSQCLINRLNILSKKVVNRQLYILSSTVYTAAELKLAVLQIRAPIIQVKFQNHLWFHEKTTLMFSQKISFGFDTGLVSFMSLSLVLPTEQIQKVQTAACFLDQIQRILQDCGSVQQPRLPEERPAAAGVQNCFPPHHPAASLGFILTDKCFSCVALL